jgi:hypothetical protein
MEKVIMPDKVFVGIDNERIELTGKELDDFLSDQARREELSNQARLEREARIAARQSARAKLAELGLTEEEIASL